MKGELAFRQWLTLVIIVLDSCRHYATKSCMSLPDTEYDTGASGNELLWIIDIYSGHGWYGALPMGAWRSWSVLNAC
ncbi:hypothetical protein KCP71_19230 [Salmonella enterica subsp. enterica]|nr:hypothetical protein KCP71_19230 [Salmonella enterica subsp. enterica]